MVRSTSNGLWYVDDTGSNVNVNSGLSYSKKETGGWTQKATQGFPGTVQQNTSTVILGDMIYTYVVDVANSKLVECYFYTTNPNYRACNHLPFDVGLNANYVGSTINKQGVRVVWWTNVGSGGNGTWSYVYNYGGGWNGPVTSYVGGYADYSYVAGRILEDNTTLVLVGLAANATGGSSVGYGTLYGSTVLGQKVNNWSTLHAAGQVFDTWVDSNQGTHMFTTNTLNNSAISYWYKSVSGQLTSGASVSEAGVVSARVVEDSLNAYLVFAKNDGTVRYKKAKKSAINGAVNWNSNPTETVTQFSETSSYKTIFPESKMYQTTEPQVEFGVNGSNNYGIIYGVSAR
jgi:hypothetical protein